MTESHEIDGHRVSLSRPDKVLFPGAGLTKRDLFDYHRRIFSVMRPHLRDRPVSVQRYPDGVEGSGFFQKNVPDHYPSWVGRCTLPAATAEKREVTYLVVKDEATMAHLADQAAITLHLGLSRVTTPDRPDRLIFDLDPSSEDLDGVRLGASALRRRLSEADLVPFVMSTGSRGLHVVCPLVAERTFEEVRDLAGEVARGVAAEHPDRLTTEVRKDARGRRVFIDVLRNAYGQTAVAPYTVRARPEAPVATPLDWDEVGSPSWHPRRHTIANLFRRLGQKEDPWAEIDAFARRLP